MKESEVKVVPMRRAGAFLLWAAASALLQVATAPNASAGTVVFGSDLSSFAILGGGGVTFDGTGSLIGGSVGGSPTPAITGYPGGLATPYPTVYLAADPVTTQAQTELGTAIAALSLLSLGSTTTESELGTLTLGPGVYVSSSTMNLAATTTLTLDGGGNANASWVFLIYSSLTTGLNSQVIVENAGAGASVYWVMQTASATLGADSTFAGNILASASVKVGAGVSDPCGRLLTQTASVTLAGSDTVDTGCTGNLAGSNGLAGGVSVPEPGTLTLLSMGLGAGFLLRRKFRSIG